MRACARPDVYEQLAAARAEVVTLLAENETLRRTLAGKGTPLYPEHDWQPDLNNDRCVECRVCGVRARWSHEVLLRCGEISMPGMAGHVRRKRRPGGLAGA